MDRSDHLWPKQIQDAVESEADTSRRIYSKTSMIEQEIEKAWTQIAPTSKISTPEHLLDQAERIAPLDPLISIESRRGLRPIKWVIRKLSFWYVRHLADQYNHFSGTLLQYLRRVDANLDNIYMRLEGLEKEVKSAAEEAETNGIALGGLPEEISPELARHIATIVGPSSALVLSGMTGNIVSAIEDIGGSAIGIEEDFRLVMTGVRNRLDIRHDNVMEYLQSVTAGEFDTVVLASVVEVMSPNKIIQIIIDVEKILTPSGRLVVAVADPQLRTTVQAQLQTNLGLSRATWQHLLRKQGLEVRLVPSLDLRISELIVANRPNFTTPNPSMEPQLRTDLHVYNEENTSPLVDLLLPQLTQADATSNHTRLMQDLLRDKGVPVRIVVEHSHETQDVVSIDQWNADASVSILQHSIGSGIAQFVIQHEIPIVLNYHNITPDTYFDKWHSELAASVYRGRQQLEQLIPITMRAIADSEFNARELQELGLRDVIVSPVLRTLVDNIEAVDNAARSIPEKAGTLLFVGRIAPNKCQHDLVSAFAMLSHLRPQSRLVLVGDASPFRYLQALKDLSQQLGVHDRVMFPGRICDEDLVHCYHSCDVFVSASEHEGFGAPLVEAMASGLPVIAYDAAAVAETLGGAGVLLSNKRPMTLAMAMDRVLADQHLRNALSDQGIQAAQRFDISVTREQMWLALKDLVEAHL